MRRFSPWCFALVLATTVCLGAGCAGEVSGPYPPGPSGPQQPVTPPMGAADSGSGGAAADGSASCPQTIPLGHVASDPSFGEAYGAIVRVGFQLASGVTSDESVSVRITFSESVTRDLEFVVMDLVRGPDENEPTGFGYRSGAIYSESPKTGEIVGRSKTGGPSIEAEAKLAPGTRYELRFARSLFMAAKVSGQVDSRYTLSVNPPILTFDCQRVDQLPRVQ